MRTTAQPMGILGQAHLAKHNIRLDKCKHCGCAPEVRYSRKTFGDKHPMMGCVVCTGCSIQTAQYSIVNDAGLTFLMCVWNHKPSDKGFESVIEKGSCYGDGTGG